MIMGDVLQTWRLKFDKYLPPADARAWSITDFEVSYLLENFAYILCRSNEKCILLFTEYISLFSIIQIFIRSCRNIERIANVSFLVPSGCN